jgi:hypothetical protein
MFLLIFLAIARKCMVFIYDQTWAEVFKEDYVVDQADQVLDQEDIKDRLHYMSLLQLVNAEVEKLTEKYN